MLLVTAEVEKEKEEDILKSKGWQSKWRGRFCVLRVFLKEKRSEGGMRERKGGFE